MTTPTTTNGYLSRERLLAHTTTLAEQDLDEPMLGGRVRIRELTAAQRLAAQQAAWAAGSPDDPNQTVFRATVIQMGLAAPALTAEDVAALVNGRDGPVQRLAGAILNLSEMLPEQLFRADTPADAAGDSDPEARA